MYCPLAAEWQIKTASFHEIDYVLTVDLELEDGTVYNNMDCTPIDETETVVLGEDVPVEHSRSCIKFMQPGIRSARRTS